MHHIYDVNGSKQLLETLLKGGGTRYIYKEHNTLFVCTTPLVIPGKKVVVHFQID